MKTLNDASYDNTLIDISKDYYDYVLKDTTYEYYEEWKVSFSLLELTSFRNYRFNKDLDLLILYGTVHRPDTLIRQSRSNSFINMNDMSTKSLNYSLETLKNIDWGLIEYEIT